MLFPSNVFLFCFFPVMLLLYFGLCRKSIAGKNMVLFIGSVIFYAYGEKWYCLLLLFSIFWNWLMGLWVEKAEGKKSEQKAALVLMLAVNLGILFAYKYLDFVIVNLNRFLGLELKEVGCKLPIGISFFTFQAISYVVDVYRKKATAQKNPFYVGLYIALFPQLIAGPIVRYETIAEQIKTRQETLEKFQQGTISFLCGLGKKVLLADTMAIFADRIFDYVAAGGNIATSMAWLGAIAYSLQIYYDFSGYSDMAIGLGKMFGFTFEENFNYPYISASVTEFWRRWHISLSTWFRDYVYIPLGGNRGGVFSTYRNLFLVWLLTGIWHGAGWTFVLWGMWYFFFLVLEKSTGLFVKRKPPAVLGRVYTLLVVVLGWTMFRAPSLGIMMTYLKKMFGIGATSVADATTWFYLKDNWIFFLAAVVLCTPVMKKIKKDGVVMQVVLAAVFLLCLIYIIKGSYSPFIYFSF